MNIPTFGVKRALYHEACTAKDYTGTPGASLWLEEVYKIFCFILLHNVGYRYISGVLVMRMRERDTAARQFRQADRFHGCRSLVKMLIEVITPCGRDLEVPFVVNCKPHLQSDVASKLKLALLVTNPRNAPSTVDAAPLRIGRLLYDTDVDNLTKCVFVCSNR